METHAFRMQLKGGMAGEYRRRHDEIWPELVALLRAAGISDYWIFLDADTNALFATLKLSADHRRESLSANPVMRRWWDYMADIMEVGPGNRPLEWALEPMFHLA